MEDSGQFQAQAAVSQMKEPSLPIVKKVTWIPEPVWTQWKRIKPLSPAINRSCVHQSSSTLLFIFCKRDSMRMCTF